AVSLKQGIGSVWQRAMVLLQASSSHGISVTCQEWRLRLQRFHVGKTIHLVPVGSNIPLAKLSEDERRRLRGSLVGSSDGFLIGGFGAPHDRDIPAVLHALRHIKRVMPARLVWMGLGNPGRRELIGIERAMAENGLDPSDVIWTERLPHTEVSRLLSSC